MWKRAAAALAVAIFGFADSAQANVLARVSIAGQSMQVYVDGQLRHSWAISSGKQGHATPRGTFRPQRLERSWYSRTYDNAPMPYSIFFRAGYAIHGGYSQMGRPLSRGCIRLTTANAATLFRLVSKRRGATRIVIS